jgi:hypothetical protein
LEELIITVSRVHTVLTRLTVTRVTTKRSTDRLNTVKLTTITLLTERESLIIVTNGVTTSLAERRSTLNTYFDTSAVEDIIDHICK